MEEILVVENAEEDIEEGDTRGIRTLQAPKNYCIKSAIHNLADIWKNWKSTILANVWKKLLFEADAPLVDFTGFESNGFINKLKSAGETVIKPELEDWLAGDESANAVKILTDAEIVDSVQQSTRPADDDDVDDPPVVKEKDASECWSSSV